MGFGADLEEFVQVAGDDAQEAQALQQRHLAPAGPIQHPLVESQDAVVTVQQRDAGTEFGGTE